VRQLSSNEVKHIAKLAKLDFSQEKMESFSHQLSAILDFVRKLKKIKTDMVSPLSNITGKRNVFREDKVEVSLTQEECLRNASGKYKGYFTVKSIFAE